jgi:response regulator NasT
VSADPAGPPRVVIAEDESIIRLDLAETFAEEGYEVVGETGRGDEVVDLVRAHEPDLAVLDIKMPGLDGVAAARAIVGLGTTAVIILTAFSGRDLVQEATAAGVHGYLVKPFQPAELVAAVEVALARHRERQALDGKVRTLQDRLEVRKLIDRAKGLLMDRDGMTERDAFHLIQRRAMDGRTTMRAVAESLLAAPPT